MKKLLLSLLLSMMVIGTLAQSSINGDVDSNGKMDISDVTALIDYLLTNDASSINLEAADVDGDGNVCIVDVTVLIDMILLAKDHEWVDLGLPSGTLWATCNVGASAPEEYGDYFAWGETEPKELYDWSTYKWCNGTNSTMTKYCTDSSYGYNGFVDNKTELDPEDDAAYVNWGENWRIPTCDQFEELKTECTWTWTTLDGVKGQLVTGRNGNTMFLPVAGGRWGDYFYDVGLWGYYWPLTLNSSRPNFVSTFSFDEGYWLDWDNSYRGSGLTVRAVRVPQD